MTAEPQTQPSLSQSEVEDWDRRWLEAWNAQQVEALLAMCTADVFLDEPSLPRPARGREEVRDFARHTFAAYPDLHIEVLGPPVLVDGCARAYSRYRLSATMTGPWMPGNLAATGAQVSFEAVDEWTFAGGLLSHCSTYYDTLGAARQLGILPAEGSRADRMLARLQHVQAWFQRRCASAA